MARTKAISLIQSGSTKVDLAELSGLVISNIQKDTLSQGLKSQAYTGNPASGSVEFKRMTLWGILQDYEVVNENMNEAQIKKRGGQMLELYNRPKRSFSVSAIADLSVRAGRALYIGIGAVGVKSFFIVEEATHDLLKETMSLKLKVV